MAQLHISSLAAKHTRKAVRAALKTLPEEIDTTYDETLQRIRDQNNDDVNLAISILYWLTYALTPLSVSALQHAIAIMTLENGCNDVGEDDVPDEDILLAVCAGLVVADEERSIIRLVHFTTQQYLERKPVVEVARAQEDISKTCIRYLSLEPFHQGPCPDNTTLKERLNRYPFTRYAACNWGHHARGIPEKRHSHLIMEMVKNKTLAASACQARHIDFESMFDEEWKDRQNWANGFPRDVPSTVIVASFGLTETVTSLLRTTGTVDLGDSEGVTPLMEAAKNGYAETLDVLLAAGADVDKRKRNGQTALISAAAQGNTATASLLLDHGADVRKKDFAGGNALCAAASIGHASTVQLVLNRGADAILDDLTLYNAIRHPDIIDLLRSRAPATSCDDWFEFALYDLLQHFQTSDSVDSVRLLIAKGASLTCRGRVGKQPIHLAAQHGTREVIDIVLAHSGIIEAKDDNGYVPLHWATFQGNLDTIQFLLDHGADINARTNSEQSALHTALAADAKEAIIKELLKHKIDIEMTDSKGRGALHEAVGRGNTTIVEFLAASGANHKAMDLQGWTPLQLANACGHEGVIEVLLQQQPLNPDIIYEDLLASARLREAIATEKEEAINGLLRTKVDVTVPSFEGRTALHHAAFRGIYWLSKELLRRGANVHARIADSAYLNRTEYEGHIPHEAYQCQWITPLHNAAANGHINVTRLLLDYGSDVRATGSENYTPLHLAASNGHAHVVKLLLEHGAPIKEDLPSGQPPVFFWAAQHGHPNVIRAMLEHGAVSEAESHWGKQVLVVAIERHHLEVVKILEEHGFTTGF